MENFKCRHHQYDSYFLPWKEDEKMSMLVVGTKKKLQLINSRYTLMLRSYLK